MCFDQRIPLEAARPEVSPLERLTLLDIYSNNLDKFSRVHVATLNRTIEYVDKSIQEEQETATRIPKQINKLYNHFYEQFEEIFVFIIEEPGKENICVIKDTEMTDDQEIPTTSFYRNKLNGSTTSSSLNGARPLDDQTDGDIYFAICLLYKDKTGKIKEKDYAVIELPIEEYGRFIQLPGLEGKTYLIFLDGVIRYCLPLIFVGMKCTDYEAYTFKLTKDAEMEIGSGSRTDVLQRISKGVKNQERGEPIRLVYDEQVPRDLLKRLADRLNADKSDTRMAGGRHHNSKDLVEFPACGRYDPKHPVQEPALKPELNGRESLLTLTRQGGRSLHYPFHSFDTLIRVPREAAINKEVESIKMTLYRLVKESEVIKALIYAAKNGKRVTVAIELPVRFDKAFNTSQSKRTQDAGIRVVFGVERLKIHSKLVHIGTRHGDIVCISIGNFHEGDARMYTDYIIMITRRLLVREANAVFGFIEKSYIPVNFKELLVSPNDTRGYLIALISKEIKNKERGKEVYILAEVNHITDHMSTEKLYEASIAGVQVELVVRGNRSLVTGIVGIDENTHINGTINRYLEHSHIFTFANGGEEKYYTGSVDWMPHNLDNRTEIPVPVYDKEIQADLERIVCYGYRDMAKGRIVDGIRGNRPWENRPSTLCKNFTPVFAETGTTTVVLRSQEELYRKYRNTLR